jgi:hypothetical protein
MDYIHIGVGCAIGAFTLANSIKRIQGIAFQTHSLYIHRNGYEWVVVLSPSLDEEKVRIFQ